MPTYILLSTLTLQGVQTLKANPERLLQVNKDIEELGVTVRHQWATLGEFDFVNVVEAPDIETIAKASVSIAARGSVRSRRCPALEVAEFLQEFLSLDTTVRVGQLCPLPDVVERAAMRDPRIDDYARLLVDRSVGVQPGWQVFLRATPLARPLVEAVQEQIARRGRLPAPPARLGRRRRAVRARGAARAARAPGAAPAARVGGVRRVHLDRGARERSRRAPTSPTSAGGSCRSGSSRSAGGRWRWRCPWVICEYPTNAARAGGGDDARASTRTSSTAPCCSTGTPRSRRMRRIAERVRRRRRGADRRRAHRPDALARRAAAAPSTTGTSTCRAARSSTRRSRTRPRARSTFCEFPALYFGHEVSGARLVFERGRIVEASAAYGRGVPAPRRSTPTTARVGSASSGIGCNPGIQRFTKNVGFDEKIDGTIHLAIGNSYSSTGGTNVSSVHWDMVKDLRNGGRIYARREARPGRRPLARARRAA